MVKTIFVVLLMGGLIQIEDVKFIQWLILRGFGEGLFTGMILIDLRKAFDTIDHENFLKK